MLKDQIIDVPGEEGLVYGQLMNNSKIEPGTMIPKGTKISLKVGKSSGESVTVPDFTGFDIASAKSMAEKMGLKVEVQPDPNATEGNIVKQKPAADESLKKGETVDVWIE